MDKDNWGINLARADEGYYGRSILNAVDVDTIAHDNRKIGLVRRECRCSAVGRCSQRMLIISASHSLTWRLKY